VTTSRIVFVLLTCAIAAGCSGGDIKAPRTSQVAGTVLKGGKPAVGVKVTFHPKFDMGEVKFTPSGCTDKNGRFILSTAAANDGAPPGDYSVTFELMKAATDRKGLDVEVDVWKGKYADPATTKWNVTVQKGANSFEPFQLD